jgi:hypothetical protein
MSYKKSDMVYDDYKWSARADHDNPKIIGGQDHSELNRTEGYEMLYFINSLAKSWSWTPPFTNSAKQLEIIIRTKVPTSIRTHTKIKQWIEANYAKV